jgi:tetratricopeptide (TPR) repeat protein
VILADAYHEKGDQEKAITILKQAIEICPDQRIKPQLESLLKEFESEK